MRKRLTDEHGFWGIVGLIALSGSLLLDGALHRTPDALVTLLDVTGLILCLATGCRLQMRRSVPFRCWVSLVIYLTTHWARDWFVVLILSCFALPFLMAPLMVFRQNVLLALIPLYGLLTIGVPTGKLVQNMRLLEVINDPDQLWRFRKAPRWVWN